MGVKQTLASCPALGRASTIFLHPKRVDGRDKPGHDGIAPSLFIASIALVASSDSVLAHPSVVPHDHPHGASALPDIGMFLLAAVLVAIGLVARRLFRKG